MVGWGKVRLGMAGCGWVWWGKVRYGLVRFGRVGCGLARFGMVRCGMADKFGDRCEPKTLKHAGRDVYLYGGLPAPNFFGMAGWGLVRRGMVR